MQNPNLPPGAQPVTGNQPPQKLTREQKRALAEQKKRMEQQRMRNMELQKLYNNFQTELATSVIDPPMMYKLANNRLKLMLKADHVVTAMFETYEGIGEICVIRQQSNLPPKPVEKADANKPKIKRVIVDGEVIETVVKSDDKSKDDDDVSGIPIPRQPPKEPPKGGQLPDMETVFINTLSITNQVRQSKQPLMIADASKFSDQQVVQFAQQWGIKSILVIPSIVNDEVEALVLAFTVQNPQGYSVSEVQFVQRLMETLSRSIETAPPVLPEKLKERVIKPMTSGQSVDKQIEYYSDYFDDIFNFMLGELQDEEDEEEADALLLLQEEQEKSSNPLRKVWYQLGKFLEFKEKPKLAYLFNIAMNELAEQAIEYADAKKLNKPRGLTQFKEFMDRRIKAPNLLDSFVEAKADEKLQTHMVVGSEVISMDTDVGEASEVYEEIIQDVNKEITKAVRGMLLFKDGRRATLINDIEQSEMLVNFVSVTAAQNFKQHIASAMPELHEDIDKEALLFELSHQGMRDISMAVAQSMAEKYLYEIESFLELPEEEQRTKMDALKTYIHYRVMANLVPTLRSEFPTLWGSLIEERIKKKASKAAKQRAVLVGRMVRNTESTENAEEDWDDEEADEEED
jgi:hypothetical protein